MRQDDGEKRVKDRVTTDLGQTAEAVFEVIALNPDEPASKIQERYNLSTEKLLDVTNELESKGFVVPVKNPDEEETDAVWRVTELGRLQLLKWVQVMRFDVMEAKLRNQPESVVERLEEKKTAFENAYRQCKVMFE